MRGWSGVPAALDTEIEIKEGVVSNPKQRDHESIRDLNLSLRTITLGVDPDGDPVTSCVVVMKAESEFDIALSPIEAETLDRLNDLGRLTTDARDKAKQPSAPADVIFETGEAVAYLQKRSKDEQTSVQSRPTINNILAALFEKGAIKKPKHGQWAIPNVWDVRNV
jgi:acyl carrier protein